jgi:hypothetical protein
MCILIAGPDGRRGAPERTSCRPPPARCACLSSLSCWPVTAHAEIVRFESNTYSYALTCMLTHVIRLGRNSRGALPGVVGVFNGDRRSPTSTR